MDKVTSQQANPPEFALYAKILEGYEHRFWFSAPGTDFETLKKLSPQEQSYIVAGCPSTSKNKLTNTIAVRSHQAVTGVIAGGTGLGAIAGGISGAPLGPVGMALTATAGAGVGMIAGGVLATPAGLLGAGAGLIEGSISKENEPLLECVREKYGEVLTARTVNSSVARSSAAR